MCKLWNETVRSDVGLQYKQELSIAGLEDGDEEFEMDVSQRLNLLREHQKAWDNFDFTSELFVDLEQDCFFTCQEIQGGVLSQKATDRSITFIQIPSKIRGISHKKWSVENLDFEFTAYTFDPSQDLLVLFEPVSYAYIFIDKSHPSDILYIVTIHRLHGSSIHLLTLTDGSPHPAAENNIIQYELGYATVHADLRVSGAFLAMTWNARSLVVWAWGTGAVRLVCAFQVHPTII